MGVIDKRYYGTRCTENADGQVVCDDSPWDSWVRWVVLAIIIIAFFLFFVLCSCVTARRRRRLGRQPMYGTGWASRPFPGHGAPVYNPHAQPYYANPNQPPPAYPPPSYGQSFYQPQPAQQHGVELQNQSPYGQPSSPQAAYQSPYGGRGGDDVYAPPAGPPPGKGDGIVR